MKVRMDWKGDIYQWVLQNNIRHTVIEELLSPVSFKMAIAAIDIPDDSEDLTLFLLRWA